MPEAPRGRFSTFFTLVPAGEVRVRGLPPGVAGSRGQGNSLLTSIAGWFAISPDTRRILAPATVSVALTPARRLVPPRPAGGFDYLSAGD